MIIWRGRGILVIVIAFGSLLLMQLVTDAMNGKGYYATHGGPPLLAMILAAIPIWLLGTKWNDEANGQHTFFFIPMQFWAILVVIFGVTLALSPEKPQPAAATESVQAAQFTPEHRDERDLAAAAALQARPVRAQEPASETTTPEIQAPVIVKVWADNVSHQYYPEDCAGRPVKAYPIARSLAKQQGYTLAFNCAE